jgi:hypothetical protein
MPSSSGWVVNVGSLQFVQNSRFDLATHKNFTDAGTLESYDLVLTVEGRVTGATPELVSAGIAALQAATLEETSGVDVTIDLNGVEQFSFEVVEAFFGPHIIEFETLPEEGNADSLWRYRMTVMARMMINNNYDINLSFEQTWNNGNLIREIWKVSAKAATVTDAVNFVNQYRPADEGMTWTLIQSATGNSASGTGVWEALQEYDETITVTGGQDYSPEGQPGDNASPLLHQLFRKALVIRIQGKVIGYNENLTIPSAHFTPSGTLVRKVAAESDSDQQVLILNADKGIYYIPYEEIWICTDSTMPTINHGSGGHTTITLGTNDWTPPNPGAILNPP